MVITILYSHDSVRAPGRERARARRNMSCARSSDLHFGVHRRRVRALGAGLRTPIYRRCHMSPAVLGFRKARIFFHSAVLYYSCQIAHSLVDMPG
ncbi:uncharacterized protein SCHCODRAFT_02614998 [Schizophyllum commune H4-8]|uniref:uncharacterized protein n=1 Tax=Schizophyllum commune (strain H4-8 / FGSC 9210) TaxID=578458 RepID=UPI0021604D80|nr:uncharacterized protein SCHCODRAFT_02614998 [Schizophyllum commune H4-8]KAI5896488.1 hypothetical protein SCHCODRAFT_02614998 [Schizophyllum commune H4-8]